MKCGCVLLALIKPPGFPAGNDSLTHTHMVILLSAACPGLTLGIDSSSSLQLQVCLCQEAPGWILALPGAQLIPALNSFTFQHPCSGCRSCCTPRSPAGDALGAPGGMALVAGSSQAALPGKQRGTDVPEQQCCLFFLSRLAQFGIQPW